MTVMRFALAGVLCAALFAGAQGLSRTEEGGVCGGAAGLAAAFEAHVKAFNTPRDIPAMLAFEEDLVELGHTSGEFVDFSTLTPEEHERRVREGAAKTELYEWTPDGVHTRVYGPTGLVWGSYLRKHQATGGATSVAEGLFTATYVCADGRWRSVLWHRSPRR